MESLSVKLKEIRLYGKIDKVGSHCKPEDTRDILNYVEDCFSKGFETLYLYTSTPDMELYWPWFDKTFEATHDSDGTIYIYVGGD